MKKRSDIKIHGYSSSVGILFSDERSPEQSSVYVCIKDGQTIVHEGKKTAMKELRDQENDPLERSGYIWQAMLKERIILVVILIILLKCLPGVFSIVGYIVFVVLNLKALLPLTMVRANLYKDRETYEQMKRYHGAEHTLINYVTHTSDERTWELSEIRTFSYLAENCGNVAAMERFLLGLFPALVIALIPVWGFWHSLLFGVVMEVIVIAGSLAGHPLLKYMQLPKVAVPGDNELELARTGIQRLLEYSKREETDT